MSHLLFFYITISLQTIHAKQMIDIFEPNIECTVVKVLSSRAALGFSRFPILYQSINNKPLTSILIIGGHEFVNLNATTDIKTDSYEKISINTNEGPLVIELHGKPISRNGTLSLNGQVLAHITCH